MRILPHNLAVLARSRLALVRIDNQIPRLRVVLPSLEVHETPLHTRWETRATSSSQTTRLDLADDPVVTLEQNLLGLVPIAILLRALEIRAVVAVEVGEDAVLVLQGARVGGWWRCVLHGGHGSLLLTILADGLVRGGGGEGADGGLGGGRGGRAEGALCGGRRRQHVGRLSRCVARSVMVAFVTRTRSGERDECNEREGGDKKVQS